MDAAAESFYALCGGLYATGGGTVVLALGNLFSPLPLMMSQSTVCRTFLALVVS